MTRIKRGVTTRAKHKNILEQAKGYRGRRKNTIRVARQAVEKARAFLGEGSLRGAACGSSRPASPARSRRLARPASSTSWPRRQCCWPRRARSSV